MQSADCFSLSRDAPKQLHVAHLQAAQLREAYAGLQEQLHNGGIPRVITACSEECLALRFAPRALSGRYVAG